jgi:phosphatidate cytidylyltransferase
LNQEPSVLKQRVITALVLLAVLLPAVFAASPWPFAVLAAVFMVAGAWEWGRLNEASGPAAVGLAAVCAVGCGASAMAGWPEQPPSGLWVVGAGAWMLAGTVMLARGESAWRAIPRGLRWTGGVAALWLAWMAVAHARLLGVNFLLSVLALVWAADIAAYFAGRAFGMKLFSRRLAPSISPGKTWEGALGGALGVLALAAVWIAVDRTFSVADPSFYTRIAQLRPEVLIWALPLLTVMSVVGDLVESMVKRSAGAKDSSGLLPGHGGVLDRVDALLPTLPLALMIYEGVAR